LAFCCAPAIAFQTWASCNGRLLAPGRSGGRATPHPSRTRGRWGCGENCSASGRVSEPGGAAVGAAWPKSESGSGSVLRQTGWAAYPGGRVKCGNVVVSRPRPSSTAWASRKPAACCRRAVSQAARAAACTCSAAARNCPTRARITPATVTDGSLLVGRPEPWCSSVPKCPTDGRNSTTVDVTAASPLVEDNVLLGSAWISSLVLEIHAADR
jgi:hypothetical protein